METTVYQSNIRNRSYLPKSMDLLISSILNDNNNGNNNTSNNNSDNNNNNNNYLIRISVVS